MKTSVASVDEDSLEDVLLYAQERGIQLWLDDDRLRYRTVRSELTATDLEKIRPAKARIIQFLRSQSQGEAPSCARVQQVPLSFSQLQHWQLYDLEHEPGVRHLARALRIPGDLDLDILERSVISVIERHDALRARIVVRGGKPVQQITASTDWQLRVEGPETPRDSSSRQVVTRWIESVILEPIQVDCGPLFAVRLLRVAPLNHVMLVALEHIIADMWSVDVFVSEILHTYESFATRSATRLPEIPMQFSDYALWQATQHRAWLHAHEKYWQDRLAGCGRVRFPDDLHAPREERRGWAILPVPISSELYDAARLWSRQNRTTVVMCFFTAFVALVLRWCRQDDMVFRFESNGRADAQWGNTIGYFTAPLFLRLSLMSRESFRTLLHRATHEYCQAHEHADASFLESRLPRPDFAGNSAFNWVSGSDQGATRRLGCEEIAFTNPVLKVLDRDTEPFMVIFERAQGLQGEIWYPRGRFSQGALAGFADRFVEWVQRLLQHPEESVPHLPAD